MGTKACLSNPPYNLKWQKPQTEDNAASFPCEVSEKNANSAFVFKGLQRSTGRSVFILPCGVLSGALKHEVEFRQQVIEDGSLTAVITLPKQMFESTSIPVCLLVFDKKRKAESILMADVGQSCQTVEREQRGQRGGASHTKRVYKKTMAVIDAHLCDELCRIMSTRENLPSWSTLASREAIRGNSYALNPSLYLPVPEEQSAFRPFADIVDDLNRIVEHKNTLRLVMNRTVAARLGFDEIAGLQDKANECTDELRGFVRELTGKELVRSDYFLLTKNMNELRFENRHPEKISEILLSILQTYKAHLMFLNNEENRILAELRDSLLPKLINGELTSSLA